ncbi:MAG: hypothetical protein A2023_05770 [Sulfuricurvum sp. GWF2_44_89]|uniref:Uncharacterized protein n=1 Tax=Sulfuricurvum kujiense TaxID=148813 RepID=A0A2D3WB65_9BACT|nr:MULTISPECIES: hypothetical protein [Sulfuricurvum]OHD77421.1 MAG: hypothetical protein A2023_05770 [Sulfuricurvum sp. GWF2_44_89]OHD91220.1 MAG: hypothetical protein A2552_04410 [Sulfuricurvum sp. RIFOXYD2_FULL_44_160]OHD93228.1 MAG: hypothetical protein A2517_06300 [Sulfuricurvum sp. RIFOXYD12_FULL_44_77]DAB38552.1 MAG TPA: hypothetical protein CFH83_05390 [Sulfuricurvum kujiense]
MYNGLSLDQAPPISVVLRFFLTVPVFGLLLALIVFFNPHAVLTPTHPLSLAAIHLMFLGVISMSMFGALFQMQSVLGGRPIPSVLGNAVVIHLFLVIGVLSLSGAFVFGIPELFVIASIFLGGSILYSANLILPLLFGGTSHDTLRGMRLALIALSLTAVLGIVMASEYANLSFSAFHDAIRSAHYSLGLIGWIAVLIVAVAFQVIEMFYVSTPYSSWCKRNAFRVIAVSLFLKIIWLFTALPYVWVFDLVIGALLIGFVVTTAKRLKMRKRRVSDVSIWFWSLGIMLLSLAVAAHILFLGAAYPQSQSISLIAFALFALAVILGMMGKIVPFLVWFHLNSSGIMDAPIMSNIIPQSRAKGVFTLFLLTSLSALGGVFLIELFVLSGLTAMGMFALLLINLVKALQLYRYTLTHGKRFEPLS